MKVFIISYMVVLVQKEFSVKPYESTLAWDGDPLEAQINIEAIYKTRSKSITFIR